MKHRRVLVAYFAVAMIGLLMGSSVVKAATVSYSVGSWSQQYTAQTTPPENAPWGPNGYPGDTVGLAAHSGSLTLAAGSYVQKINTLLWTIDYTYGGTATNPDAWSDLTFAINAIRSMSFDGGSPKSIAQPGTLKATWDNDFLSLAGGPTVTFVVPGYQIDVTPLGVAEVGGSNFSGGNPWTQPSRDVMARFDVAALVVPLPQAVWAAMPLLGCMAGVKLFRRPRHASFS